MNAPAAPLQIEYKNKTALVIDDFPSMRSAFRTALAAFGLTKVDMAATASEAMIRVKNTSYDIVISDYNLGEGRDGQQVLEEMRYLGMIGLETAYLMVTAESVYERVVAAAELAPDDYLIKPFNADIMRARLDSILAKKQTFSKVYRSFSEGDLESALAGCDQLINGRTKYLVDAMRFKGEVLIAIGRFDEASELYEQVVKLRAVPWARLGLARTMHLRDKSTDAEHMLVDLVGQYPELVAGYDLLADVQLAQNKFTDAQVTLKNGVDTSPRSLLRQRRLGEVSYRNGDLTTSENAFFAAVNKGRYSMFLKPNDFANLSRVYIDKGNSSDAIRVLQDNRKLLQESEEGKLISSVMLGLAYDKSGNKEESTRLMQEAVQLRQAGADGNPDLLLNLAEGCLKTGFHDEAAKLVSEVARNAHDSAHLLDKAKHIYQEAGKPDVAQEVIRKATEHVITLSKQGALKVQRGELGEAVKVFLQAADEAPRNPRVLMNAIWVALRLMEQDHSQSQYLPRVQIMLSDVAYVAPDHPRLSGLQTKLRAVEAALGYKGASRRRKG